MASGSKADLARASTMEVTSKEGKAYLDRNLTQWKKQLLLDPPDDIKDSAGASSGKQGGKRSALQDSDSSHHVAKKLILAKATTMEVTAKEGKDLIGGHILGDTRQVTKAKQKKGATKRAGTMVQVVAEAKALGTVSSPGSARSLRKRQAAAKVLTKKPVAKKAALKKAGTMQKTAKEARGLLGKEELGDTRQVTKAKAKQKQKAKTAKKMPKKAKK